MRYLLSFLLCFWTLSAATYYVATDGVNTSSRNGSIDQPWRTIRYGLQTMPGGSTLVLRGGTYTESHVYESAAAQTVWKDGAEGSPTTVKNHPGETAIVAITQTSAGTGFGFAYPRKWVTLDGLVFSGANSADDSVGVRVNMHNGVITNCQWINWNDAVALQPAGQPSTTSTNNWSHDVHIVDCTFSNLTSASVACYPFSGYRYTIERNLFTHSNDRAIEFGSSEIGYEVHGMTIRRNAFLPGGGITFRSAIFDQIPSNTGVEIYNNLVVDCSGVRVALNTVSAAISTAAAATKIHNNTIVQTVAQTRDWLGIYVRQLDARIVNNIVWGTFKNPIYVRSGRTGYITNTISGPSSNLYTGATIVSANDWNGAAYDPMFEDSPDDLRIGVTGWATANGANLSSLFADDYHGDTRTVPWDIGAIMAGSDGGGEDPDPPVVELPLIPVSSAGPAFEGGPVVGTFTITRAGSTDGNLNVEFAMTGTAVSNVNYTLSHPSPLTINNAEESATITVTPVNSGTIGTTEAILTIEADAAYTVSSVDAATLEIYGSGQSESGIRRTFGGAGALGRRPL